MGRCCCRGSALPPHGEFHILHIIESQGLEENGGTLQFSGEVTRSVCTEKDKRMDCLIRVLSGQPPVYVAKLADLANCHGAQSHLDRADTFWENWAEALIRSVESYIPHSNTEPLAIQILRCSKSCREPRRSVSKKM